MSKPTSEQFRAYEQAFDYFNRMLFQNELPDCLLNFSRKDRAKGFFSAERWSKDDQSIPEISLNPDVLQLPAKETMATLAHEQAHLWQYAHGKPSGNGYHNREWAEKMQQIGLMPSDTGLPGGKQTGSSMTHYIIEDGLFSIMFEAMPPDFLLPWVAKSPSRSSPQRRDKVKYSCPGCALNMWGKAGAVITCWRCQKFFTEKSG